MTSRLPLEGIRVLDLTQVYAGPTCTRILSDLGADVIKLEGLKRMDITRNFVMPENTGKDDYWNRSGYFLLRNGGKKSLTLDFGDPEAVELVKRLVPHADIVAESFTPRVMAKFGLDYESLKAAKPEIIMVSLSGYGQTGPWRDFTAYGMGLEPASGISSLTGYRDGPPLRTGISFTDPYSGVVGAGAVLSALHYRRRTGKGQYIDLSEHESAVPVTGFALMDYALNGRMEPRMGNRSHWYAPQGCYRCKGEDNWIAITVRDDAEWECLLPRCRSSGMGDRPLRGRALPLRAPRRARRAHHLVDARAGPYRGDAPPPESRRHHGGSPESEASPSRPASPRARRVRHDRPA